MPTTAMGPICPPCLLERGKSSASGDGSRVSRPPLEIADLQRRFPQLEILEFVGSGGMGGVYRARQPQLERDVALKVITIGDQAERHERFLREGKALAQLNHPHIVQVHDSGVVEGLGYFVMEYVDGQSLQSILLQEPVSPEEAEDLVLQICEALEFAHDRGITHRDIKPGNILVGADGRVKIADFGLAKALQTQPSGFQLTLSQELVGTPYYMAPEQRAAGAVVDHRADLYALGVVYYEMLTRRLPIGRVDRPSVYCPLDERLDELVLSAMDSDPNKRPQSARSFRETLVEVRRAPKSPQRSAETVPVVPGKRAHGSRWQSFGRAAFWCLTLGPLFGALAGGVATWQFPITSYATSYLKVTHPSIWKLEGSPMDRLGSEAVYRQVSAAMDLPSLWNGSQSQVLQRLQAETEWLPEANSDRIRVRFDDPNHEHAIAVVGQLTKVAASQKGSQYLGRATIQVNRNPRNWNIFSGDVSFPIIDPMPAILAALREKFRSPKVIRSAIERAGLEGEPGLPGQSLVGSVRESLDLEEVADTDLMIVTYWDGDPQRVVAMINALVDEVADEVAKEHGAESSQAIEMLERQVEAQRAKVAEARNRLESLEEAYRNDEHGELEGRPGNENSPEVGGESDSQEERRRMAAYAEASQEHEVQKTLLASMERSFQREQTDTRVSLTPLTIQERATEALPAPLPLEVDGVAAITGRRGPNSEWLVMGMVGIGLGLGLLVLYPVASSLERRRRQRTG